MNRWRLVLPVVFGIAAAASAGDYARVSIGPGRLSVAEGAEDTILIDSYRGIDYLMVEPKIGTFTGLTYKLGVKFAPSDIDAINRLKKGRSFTVKIHPVSDDNLGKSFVDASFRSAQNKGKAVAVAVDPATSGQSTSGTIKVVKGGTDSDPVITLSFRLKVKGLVVEQYDSDGVRQSIKSVKGRSSFTGTVRVSL